ncbi:hypothetical protein [Photobacterium marinum]|nr:hypothetical protein [Photobacterium marinum]
MLYHVRSKPHNINREAEFVSGRVSIGWPCGRDLRGLSRKELEDILNEQYKHHMNAHNVSQVEQFLHIKSGSIILTPSEADKKEMHIFRTLGNVEYNSERDNNTDGDPHGVAVELLITVKKSLLPTGVQSSLKGAKKTVSNFSKHASAMKQFLEKAESLEKPTVTTQFEVQEKAKEILIDALNSDIESIRVTAAAALYQPS